MFTPDEVSLLRGHGVQHVINVVHIPVLHLPMHLVLGHGDIWTIEHTGLIHIIPSIAVQSGALVHRQLVLLSKIVPGFSIQKVRIVACTRPAPSFIVIAILVLHIQPLAREVIVHPVAAVLLDVRVHDGDQLSTVG